MLGNMHTMSVFSREKRHTMYVCGGWPVGVHVFLILWSCAGVCVCVITEHLCKESSVHYGG